MTAEELAETICAIIGEGANGCEEEITNLIREKDKEIHKLQGELYAANQRIRELIKGLRMCRDAIDSLHVDALGVGSDGYHSWPIKEEIIHNLKLLEKEHGDE